MIYKKRFSNNLVYISTYTVRIEKRRLAAIIVIVLIFPNLPVLSILVYLFSKFFKKFFLKSFKKSAMTNQFKRTKTY